MVNGSSGARAALLCGSLAYDTILVSTGRFKARILPDKLHILNVSFLVPEMRREYGGCAANIAYNLNLLRDHGIPMATAGHDFGPYRERLEALGVPVQHITVLPTSSPRRRTSPPTSMTIRSPHFILERCRNH